MLFGKYCLLERTSVGGMAEVFRAKPLPAHRSSKLLALKRILPHLAEDDEFITMFVDEAKLTVQLEHPNIVETYELGNFQSSYYILMEYIAGADVLALQKRLRRRRKIMSVAQACYVARGVARGLHYAHQACDEQGNPFNIIHRDISPQNIRLTFDGRVKLIDFGIAKAAVQRTKTQVGVLKGKFGYMSPEQVRGEDIDHRTDVYALGTCLWEMLTNRRLFNGENEFETLQMVKHPDVPPPSEKNSQVPPEVDRIVMRALAPDADERYQTAREFAEELDAFISNIDQPYTQNHLAQWMASTFSEELADERSKREAWQEIETATDVKRFNKKLDGEDVEPVAGEAEEIEGEEEQVWDPDFAPDDEEGDVDHQEFAANHTVVAAGGFDPSMFSGNEDDDIISLAEDDLIEVEDGFDEAELEAASSAPSSRSGQRAAASQSGQHQQQSAPESHPGRAQPQRAKADSGGTHPGFEAASEEEIEKAGKVSAVRVASAVAAVIAVVGLAGAIGYMTLGGASTGQAAVNSKATLVINVTPNPTRSGKVLIDGYEKGTSAPLTVSDLDPGEHLVEMRYPGYADAERRIKLGAGDLKTINVDLKADPNALAHLKLEMPEGVGDSRVFVDGEEVDAAKREGGIDLEPGKHLIEVLGGERQPWSRVISFGGGESAVEHVDSRPKALQLTVEAGDGHTVVVDGEEAGEGRVEIDELDPHAIHTVALKKDGRTVWQSALGFPTIGEGLLDLESERPEELSEEDLGWLEASTGSDWWSVLVDGVQTGLHTPLQDKTKIPVEPGGRRVTFRRGNKMQKREVEVEGGETAELDETLPFEWSSPEL